jgi:hypothetical protein
LAAFYGTHVLPRTSAHEAVVRHGYGTVAQASAVDL